MKKKKRSKRSIGNVAFLDRPPSRRHRAAWLSGPTICATYTEHRNYSAAATAQDSHGEKAQKSIQKYSILHQSTADGFFFYPCSFGKKQQTTFDIFASIKPPPQPCLPLNHSPRLSKEYRNQVVDWYLIYFMYTVKGFEDHPRQKGPKRLNCANSPWEAPVAVETEDLRLG